MEFESLPQPVFLELPVADGRDADIPPGPLPEISELHALLASQRALQRESVRRLSRIREQSEALAAAIDNMSGLVRRSKLAAVNASVADANGSGASALASDLLALTELIERVRHELSVSERTLSHEIEGAEKISRQAGEDLSALCVSLQSASEGAGNGIPGPGDRDRSIPMLPALNEWEPGMTGIAAAMIENMREHAAWTLQTVRNAASAAHGMREHAGESIRTTKRFGERALELGQIVSEFEELSDRAALLALNSALHAPVDAERAMYGSELADVADRSGQLAKKVRELYRNVSSEAKSASAAAESVVRNVVTASGAGDPALRSITMILNGLEELAGEVEAAAGRASARQVDLNEREA